MKMYEELCRVFKILKSRMNEDSLTKFKAYSFENLNDYHFSLGLVIRNDYLNSDSALYSMFKQMGIDDKDEISALMIKLFYFYIK